jgi:hypothetical protein
MRRRRRRLLALLVVVFFGVLALAEGWLPIGGANGSVSPFRARIVDVAVGQIGYRTNPADSYCNRFSAYWYAGTTDCPSGERAEEWCADFAAWVWHQAGAEVAYGYAPGELDGAAYSFYEWGVDHGRWHPVGSGYVPQPGDVAVYGLDVPAGTAKHVAVVTSYTAGDRGPNVVNGDGSRTGFSVVESWNDQWHSDVNDDGGPIAGYVSPAKAS